MPFGFSRYAWRPSANALPLQRAAAGGDRPQAAPAGRPTGEEASPPLNAAHEDGEVVIVAEQAAEFVVLVRVGLHRPLPDVAQQPVVVPEILHALAPLVQALGRGIADGSGELLAAAAVRVLGTLPVSLTSAVVDEAKAAARLAALESASASPSGTTPARVSWARADEPAVKRRRLAAGQRPCHRVRHAHPPARRRRGRPTARARGRAGGGSPCR